MEYKLIFKDFNKALKKGKLLGLKCGDCGAITVPPKMVCSECTGTDLEITELGGKGTIQTFTANYVAAEGRECEAPYTIVMIELDEGPWVMGNLIDIDPKKVDMKLIGKRVKMGVKVFPGDKYSAGDMARPLFSFE